MFLRIAMLRGLEIGKRIKDIGPDIILIVSCWIIISIIFLPYLKPGFAYGSDVQAHFYIAEYIADFFSEHHAIPNWDPNWYAGFGVLHNIPPFVYILLGGLQLIFKDIRLVSKIYYFIWAYLYSLIVYLVVKRKYGRFSGITAAVLATLAPMSIRFLGSATRSASIFFLPLCLFLTDKVLEDGKLHYIIILSFLMCLSILSHVMFAGFFILSIFLYALVRTILEQKIIRFRLFMLLLAPLFAFFLSSFWFIPFYFEEEVRRSLTEELIVSHSVPNLSSLIDLMGVTLIVFGFLAMVLKRNSINISLFIVGCFGLIFSLKDYSPIYHFPYLNIFYPKVGLASATFFFSYLTSSLISDNSLFNELLKKRRLTKRIHIPVRTLIVAIIILTCIVNFNGTYKLLIHTWDTPESVMMAAETIKDYPNDGRAAFYFSGGKPAFIHYALTKIAEKPSIEGHYYLFAPLSARLPHIYDSIKEGYPLYAISKFRWLNIRYIICSNKDESEANKHLVETLENDGFTVIKNVKNFSILYKNDNSTYVQPADTKMLAIGKYSSIFARLFPEAVEGSSIYVDDYEKEYLDNFELLILYGFGFRNERKADILLKDFLTHGTIIVDLFGQKTTPLQTPGLFGVIPQEISLSGKVSIKSSPQYPQDIAGWDFSKLEQPWMAVGYYGLDENLLELEGENVTIFGVKNVEGRKAYFFGGNWFYYTYQTKDEKNLKLLQDIVDLYVKSENQNELVVKEVIFTPQDNVVKFTYSASHATPALVSMAYSPHWRAYADDQPIKTYCHDYLIYMTLPEGVHEVLLEYETLPLHVVFNLFSALTFLFLAFLLIREGKK